MGTYGRNLEFRIPPQSENRAGRFSAPITGNPIPIGAPVIADTGAGTDALGRQIVELATGAQAPIGGQSGIAVFEYAPAAFAGFDPFLTTYSDLSVVPLGQAVQVVSGPYVKVVFTNTVAELFLGQRQYTGRTMVAGLSATPTVTVGAFLTPGIGDDNDGYWAVTTNEAVAWLVVTLVDPVRVQVEARMLF
jgi:hypothetical protein